MRCYRCCVVVVVFLSFILLNVDSVYGQTHSDSVDYSPDFGTVNSPPLSHFEEFFSHLGPAVPENFDDLNTAFENFMFERGRSVLRTAVSVGDSRSPERDVTSFEHPRELTAYAEVRGRGDTFIGYNETIEQLQIISWSGKRFEFLEVNGFGSGRQPQISHPEREFCMSCHQSGGPIFSRRPWDETASNPEVRARIREVSRQKNIISPLAELARSRGAHGLAGELEAEGDVLAVGNYDFYPEARDSVEGLNVILASFGIPPLSNTRLDTIASFWAEDSDRILGEESRSLRPEVRQPETNAFVYDTVVRGANRKLQSVEICHSLCGDDLECKRMLLLLGTLDRREVLEPDVDRLNLEFASMMADRWSEDRFAYPSSVLPDRDPLRDEDRGGRTSFVVPVSLEGLNEQVLADVNSVPFRGENIAIADLEAGVSPVYIEDVLISRSVELLPGVRDGRVFGIAGPADPALPRPLVGRIPLEVAGIALIRRGLSQCFDLRESDLDSFSEVSIDRLRSVLLESPLVEPLLEPWPPEREPLMEVLHAAIEESYETDYQALCDQVFGHQSLVEEVESLSHDLQQELIQNVNREEVVPLFTQYCLECHGADGRPELPLTDVDALKSYRMHDGTSLMERIEQMEMPPRRANQPSLAERAQMLALLSESSEAVEISGEIEAPEVCEEPNMAAQVASMMEKRVRRPETTKKSSNSESSSQIGQ